MEIKDVFMQESFDPVFESNQTTGNQLSRGECEAMSLEFFGSSTPLMYAKVQDKFLIEKLTAR